MNYPKPEILSLPALKRAPSYVSVPGYGSMQRIQVYDEQVSINNFGDFFINQNKPSSAFGFEADTKRKPWKYALTICFLIILAPALAFIISDIIKIRNKNR